jgi:hypothetical protein
LSFVLACEAVPERGFFEMEVAGFSTPSRLANVLPSFKG